MFWVLGSRGTEPEHERRTQNPELGTTDSLTVIAE